MSPLEIFLLGPPRIEQDGRPLQMDTRKAIALLAYLALTGERQTRDSLAAFLWPEYDDSRGKAALRRTLSTLKAAVGDSSLDISREAIGLREDQVWCDVIQFQHYIAVREWEPAVALYRDDFLAGFSLRDSIPFDDWQVTEAEVLRREMSIALEARCRQLQAAGALTPAIKAGHRWLNMDPLREDAHRLMMLLYAQSGQRNKALEQFRSCVRILDEELGVSPLPETVALYDAIRDNQIPALASTHGAPPAADDKAAPAAGQAKALPAALPAVPLIGRKNELQQMQRLYQQVGPDGRLLTLEGETGIGKTRLAEAFLAGSQQKDRTVLFARCYEGENNLAYAPVIQVLRDGLRQPQAAANLADVSAHALAEAGRLLPELLQWQDVSLSLASLDAPGAQNRFYEGIGQVLSALLKDTHPGILWLDDTHWLDSASLELLLFLLRRWSGRPYLILLCWRTEFLPADHPFYGLVADLRRAGASSHLQLKRFTPQEVSQLLAAVLPAVSPDLADKLYRETEGLPYFVVEYLHVLVQQETSVSAATLSWDIPRTVRDLLAARLAHLDETERQLLQTAAAVGHASGYDLLHLASGRSDEETVSSLESLGARGLLVEQAAGYDFSHAKLSELTYAEMGLARRRLLHRRVAESLAQSQQRQSPGMTLLAEIAHHYQLAGQDREAAGYFVLAGDQARALFAHREGVHYYQSALALGYEEAWKLHEASGDMYVRLGEYDAALASYETAASLAELAELGRLEHKLGQVYMRRGAWPQAQAQLALAKENIDQADQLARLYIDWSTIAFNLKEFAQAKRYAQEGRQLADTPQIQAQSENVSGLLARHEGAYEQAVAHFQRSLQLSRVHELPDTEIAALNNLALTEAAGGASDDAQENFSAALVLCQTYGDRHREAALHNNLADLFHQIGDENRAMAELKTAVAIYAEIGGQPGNWQPEIWKLTEW